MARPAPRRRHPASPNQSATSGHGRRSSPTSTDSQAPLRGPDSSHTSAVARLEERDPRPVLARVEDLGGGAARGVADPSMDGESMRWRLLLCGASPREVLARIVRDDPLRLRARIGARLLERCLLLDADRALLRAFARIARAACRYQGRPDLGPWLDGHVDLALDDCRKADARATSEPRGATGAFLELSRPLRLDPARLGAACALFNELDDEARRVFFRLLLRRPAGEDAVRKAPAPAELAAARRALEPFLALGVRSLAEPSLASAPLCKREVPRAR